MGIMGLKSFGALKFTSSIGHQSRDMAVALALLSLFPFRLLNARIRKNLDVSSETAFNICRFVTNVRHYFIVHMSLCLRDGISILLRAIQTRIHAQVSKREKNWITNELEGAKLGPDFDKLCSAVDLFKVAFCLFIGVDECPNCWALSVVCDFCHLSQSTSPPPIMGEMKLLLPS